MELAKLLGLGVHVATMTSVGVLGISDSTSSGLLVGVRGSLPPKWVSIKYWKEDAGKKDNFSFSRLRLWKSEKLDC